MKKEWFAAKDLVGINGLPTTTQGIHGMARRQGWETRRRLGVQGKAVEYHINSLPKMMKPALIIQEKSAEYLCSSYHDPLLIWIESYKQLNDRERETIVSFIVREGMLAVIKRLMPAQEEIE
ncbi:DNA-binding protein [Rouxiella sp. WC2420]|uniref:DNA-binding protein n=1 Tax=Rouxiella sp. WC2420 TaxID=3234145 RepID=A0AB39VT76_9GAMM